MFYKCINKIFFLKILVYLLFLKSNLPSSSELKITWAFLKIKKKTKKKPQSLLSTILWNLTVLSSLNLKLFHVLYMIFNHIILFWIYGIVSWFDTMLYRIILYYMKHYSLNYIKQCCTFIIWYIYISWINIILYKYIYIYTEYDSVSLLRKLLVNS